MHESASGLRDINARQRGVPHPPPRVVSPSMHRDVSPDVSPPSPSRLHLQLNYNSTRSHLLPSVQARKSQPSVVQRPTRFLSPRQVLLPSIGLNFSIDPVASMSRLMAAMLLGGARVGDAAALTGTTAVKALPRTLYVPPRPQQASWSRLCLQTAPRSSQVRFAVV